jgi:hypothetical protein
VNDVTPWIVLLVLGAFHGLNPAMGWLFAVARGLQERDRKEVTGSLIPLAAGHALSIALVVATFGVLQATFNQSAIRYGSGAVLIGFALFKIAKPRSHPKWVGMRVGRGMLALWSFLMASAHGAGLMLVPALGSATAAASVAGDHHLTMAGVGLGATGTAVAAVAVHTLALLIITGGVAVVVFDRVGVGFLRKAWFNVDLVWAAALVLAGLYILLLGVG